MGVLKVGKLLKLAGGEVAKIVWFLLHFFLKAVMNLWRMLMILMTLGKANAVGKTRYCECSALARILGHLMGSSPVGRNGLWKQVLAQKFKRGFAERRPGVGVLGCVPWAANLMS